MFRTEEDDEEQQALHKDECLQIKKACHQLDPTYKFDLTYIIVRSDVSKYEDSNSSPGFVFYVENTAGSIYDY